MKTLVGVLIALAIAATTAAATVPWGGSVPEGPETSLGRPDAKAATRALLEAERLYGTPGNETTLSKAIIARGPDGYKP